MLSEVVVIGGGPGGVSCALYLVRLGVAVRLVSENIGGKQNHYQIIHGLAHHRGIAAPEYVADMKEAIASAGRDEPDRIQWTAGRVAQVRKDDTGSYHIHLEDGTTLQARYVVVASGSSTDRSTIPVEVKAEALTFEDFPFKSIGASKRVLVLGAGYSSAEMVQSLTARGCVILVVDLDRSSYQRLPVERRKSRP